MIIRGAGPTALSAVALMIIGVLVIALLGAIKGAIIRSLKKPNYTTKITRTPMDRPNNND